MGRIEEVLVEERNPKNAAQVLLTAVHDSPLPPSLPPPPTQGVVPLTSSKDPTVCVD